MTKKLMQQYKKRLVALKARIVGEIDHIAKDTLGQPPREASGDLSSYTYHMADMATDNYNQEFSLNIASTERRTLIEIDDALKRMEEGSYGTCESCGHAIAQRRLQAVPYARLCVKCQEESEGRRRRR